MKKTSILFLQGVVVLIGIAILASLILFPQTEGRAKNLDWIHIYADPFILYSYVAAIPFFMALYKAFQFLGYVAQNQVFSKKAVDTLRCIKKYAIIECLLIILAGILITIFHHQDDDPAGFIAICLVASFASIVVAVVTSVFEKIIQNALDTKSENENL